MQDPVASNPLAGNPLVSRADVERAARDLFAPLVPFFSEGAARVRLDWMGATHDRVAGDLEGFARPLWGLAPLGAVAGDEAHWALYRRGIANGTDPAHPEYWGAFPVTDQRMCEMAALGFAMRLVPELVWEPLEQGAKDNLARYLLDAREKDYFDNNWKFFRVILDLGLARCGIPFDRGMSEAYLRDLDGFYMADGWYSDGRQRQADHYIGFAMHFYGLIYSRLGPEDDPLRQVFQDRARRFAADFAHWFDEDGGVVAFGRSLTYRFACAGFWAALAFADIEALPWGEIKGHYLRHLRWWSRQPIADRDGVLSVGYGYANLFLSESYNTAGSPYWAFKAFLPLALPEDHPFWTARELPPRPTSSPVPLRQPGLVMMPTPGNVVMLSSGQQNLRHRAGTEKYAKMAYSSRYAFSLEVDERDYDRAAFDGTLGLSDDGRHYRTRESCIEARIADDMLFSRWQPWPDVEVSTWLVPAAPWHLRLHRITTARPLHATEGGFAIARADGAADTMTSAPGHAVAEGATDISAIFDLAPDRREGRCLAALPNTNLIASKTTVPQLRGSIPAGVTVLQTAVLAIRRSDRGVVDHMTPPPPADLARIEEIFRRDMADVGIMAMTPSA